MIMKLRARILFTTIALAAVITPAVLAQDAPQAQAPAPDLSTTFTSGSKEVVIGNDTEWQADDPFSETPVLHLKPKEGVKYASVTITDGTEVTKYTAKKIRYAVGSEALLMEEDARIERGKQLIAGSVSIEYLPEKLIMTVKGTKKAPAEIRYIPPKGLQMHSRAPEFHIAFVKAGDDVVVKTITPVY
ncbi:MAG: hypothetical protein GC154_12625 [bacterium]|nr:hypothetical protein [bacterium]